LEPTEGSTAYHATWGYDSVETQDYTQTGVRAGNWAINADVYDAKTIKQSYPAPNGHSKKEIILYTIAWHPPGPT
jgi:hypothetical protein